MNLKRILCTMTLFIGAIIMIYGQTITGVVVDATDNTPLVGASVVVDKKNKGTMTNLDGKYSIEASEGDVLIFSFIGMEKQSIKVGKSLVIDVALNSDNELEEVVFVGYAMVKKSDLTGSVSSLKSEELLKSRPISVEQGMQGRLAGVNVTRDDGAPGGGISIQVRGANSFNSKTEPLYVIDGVPLTTSNSQESINFSDDKDVGSRNALSFLDPKDIESIEVLKDGSSIAIYGSRGANGVVMITTKSGSIGKDKIEVAAGFTIGKISRKLDVMGARDYAIYQNESTINGVIVNTGSYDPDNVKLPYPGKNNDLGNYQKGPDDFSNDPHYWQDQIFRTSFSKDASVAFSGGKKGFNYRVGASFLDQEGIVENSNYKRSSLRFSINKDINSWLKFGSSTSFSVSDSKMLKNATKNQNNGDEGVIRSALYYPPTYLVEDNVTLEEFSTVANPVQYTKAPNNNKNYSVFTSNYIEAKLMDGLVYKMVLGYNISHNAANRYFPRYLNEGKSVKGRSEAGDNLWNSTLWDNMLMYNKSFDRKHNINATLATSWEESSWHNKMIMTEGFGTDANGGAILEDGTVTLKPKTNRGDKKMLSYIFRGAYDYNRKYYLTLTGRIDQSSVFAKNHKSAFFPSFGLAWRATGEEFLSESEILTNLKFRYSYGCSGNDAIGPYQSLPGLIGANYPFGNNASSGYGPDQYKPGNPNLKWETTRQHDLGVDISLWNRLHITADYYNKTTVDLLQYVEQPGSTGIVHMMTNLGEVNNRGFELTIDVALINTGGFRWNAGFNFATNRNKLLSVGEQDDDIVFPNKIYGSLRPLAMKKEHPIGALYGFKEEGIWNTRKEVINSDQFQAIYPGYKVSDNVAATEQIIRQKWVGEIRYYDKDESGVISDADQDFIGDVNPDFSYGFNMNFEYKNFDFSFLFSGVKGNDIFNLPAMRYYNLGPNRNTLKAIYDGAWRPDSFGRTNPKIYYDSSRSIRFSRRFIEDGSFLKLRNITFGYTVQKPVKEITSLRVYFSANNLFTITNYTGYDPEINSFGSDASLRGIDAGGYPQSREFTLGLNLTF